MNYTRDKKILLTVYFLFYYAVFLFFFIDHRLLAQYQPIFFNYNRDLSELALIAAGLPRFMIGHPWTFPVVDGLLLFLPFPLLIYNARKGRFSRPLGIAFSLSLVIYLLLANIFWQCHPEPFILYPLLSLAFFTNRADRFYALLEGARYYFLYLFVSAAVWKITRGAAFNVEELSNILLFQHADILTANGTSSGFSSIASPAGHWYAWLIDHPRISYSLYLGSVLLEASFIIGFFTRRWDRVLLGLSILFVIADLLVMRIPYWTILLGGITLWLSRPAQRRNTTRKIVIYETTHHENLPALLDLSEVHFSKVTVFLKELSYHSILGEDGQKALAARWPATEFIVQPGDCPNRAFIARINSFLRNNDYSHLHLATLDNNLLFFSLRLFWIAQLSGRRTRSGLPPLHISLTVHEIGEYFTYRFNNLRAITESIAKYCLHRQIRHYHFFLPAMVESFRQRLPGAIAVFIPSRFYPAAAAPAPPPPAPKASPASFSIVIPGTVDPNRRNYQEVTDLFTHYLQGPATPARAIQLVLLGNSDTPYGTGIVNKLRQLGSTKFSLRSYQGHIPQTEYERQLSEADLIWSPLKVEKLSVRHNPETYGLTTASGLTADLLLNATPALVPADLLIPGPFRAALLPYQSHEEVQQHIDRLINDPAHRLDLRNRIHAAFSLLTKERFNPAFAELTGLDEEGKERGDDTAKPVGHNGHQQVIQQTADQDGQRAPRDTQEGDQPDAADY